MLTRDTNVELRLTFDYRVDRRVPSFEGVEVRTKTRVVTTLLTRSHSLPHATVAFSEMTRGPPRPSLDAARAAADLARCRSPALAGIGI